VLEQLSSFAVPVGFGAADAHAPCAGSGCCHCNRRHDPQYWATAWDCDDRRSTQEIQPLEFTAQPELRGENRDHYRGICHGWALRRAGHPPLTYRIQVSSIYNMYLTRSLHANDANGNINAMAPRCYGAAAPAPTCGMLYDDGQI
jgi:hypothetical protein